MANQSRVTNRNSILEQSLIGSSNGRFAYSRTPTNSNLGKTYNSSSGTTLRLFDLNGDRIVSNEELVDVALIKHFSDPEMASPYNNNAGDITRLVAKVDLDYNGQISDIELAKALLADRRGELSSLDSNIKNYLLNKNLNRTAIETELNKYDGPNSDHVINDLEVLDKLTALKAAGTTITATTRAILGTNSHYFKIQELLNNTNFSEINTPTEIFDFLLNARRYGVEDVFATRELSGNNAILKLVQNLDKDKDGTINQKEFIAGYVAITKKGNPDQLDLNLFNSLLTSQTKFSNIPAFINQMQIDSIGNINETQAATLIANANSNDRGLFLDVVTELSTNNQFKNLLGFINSDSTISTQELVSIALASRSPAFSSIQTSTFNTLINMGGAQGTAYYNAVSTIDKTRDGIIDDNEVRDALLNQNANPNAYPGVVLADILGTNPKYTDIKQLVDIFDTGNTKNGSYSDQEIVQGLLKIKELKLNVNTDNLKTVLSNNNLLETLPDIVNMFDKDRSGTISEEEYASVMVAIAKGNIPEIDPNLIALIETQVPNTTIIKNAIQSFANDFDRALTPQELINKFRLLTNNSDGSIDPNKLSTMTKVIGIIYPNADQLINMYLDFDSNHDDHFNDDEVIKGLLKYNSSLQSNISKANLNSIAMQAEHYEDINYALARIDIKIDGEFTNSELVDAMLRIKRGDFADDPQFKYTESDDTGIVNKILATNSNYALVERVMSTFNYTPGYKPTALDLAASLLIQNSSTPQGVSDADKDAFLQVLGLTKVADTDQTKKIKDEITKINSSYPDAFDPITKELKTNVLMDKLILISLGKIKSTPELLALLRTNSHYDQMNKLFTKYAENKKLTENSLIRMLVDANLSDPKLQITEDIKNYFISLFKGELSSGFLADYKANLNELVDSKLIEMTTGSSFDQNMAKYTKAINILDSDHNGKMTSSDYALHNYYFSNQYGSTNSSYDFDNNGIVDDQDKLIFDKVSSYLKLN